MKILGISGALSCPNHDCSASLLIDGKLIGNYEEERFNRIKHSVGKFPLLSIRRLLNEHNLKLDDIDAIGVSIGKENEQLEAIKLIDPNCKRIPKFIFHSHHMGHICDTFYQSGFESAAVVIVDGDGDNKEGITIAHIKNNKIEILKTYDFRKSLGFMYTGATGYCGLGYFGEGKLMGLTSYGNDLGVRLLTFNNETKDIDMHYKTISFEEIKQSQIPDTYVTSAFSKFYDENFYPYHERLDDMNILYYIHFAKTIQENFNEVYIDVVKYAKELTGEDNLCVTGGCIQNCIGNNLIVESGIFKHVFAPPAPHDAGCGAGYAFYAANHLGETIENNRLTNSYVGKTYTDDEIIKSFDDSLTIKEYNQNDIIKLLKNNKIISWFQGGSELGPRALGHRSILANPSDRENLDKINNNIKLRENWRPLAPVVPAELFDLIFDVKSYDLTEFMLRTIPIKKEWQKKLCAVCHIDGTTRPQRLVREVNPELYDLIMEFYKVTGIPCLVNTSFNGKNEPIIETPSEAINFLKRCDELNCVVFNTKYTVSI